MVVHTVGSRVKVSIGVKSAVGIGKHAKQRAGSLKPIPKIVRSSESGSESDCTEVEFETEMDGEELFTKMTTRNAAAHAVDVPKAFEQPQQAPMVAK